MKRITLLFILSSFINGVFGDDVSVMEGDSVTLHTNDADIQAADDVTVIWTYEKARIARINRKVKKAPIYDADVLDGKFKDRLKMDDQTGDLTITNITTTDSGLYEVEITVGTKNIPKSFNVKGVVGAGGVKSVSLMEGDSVTLLTDDPDIKKYDVILWRFQHENSPLAEINRTAGIFSTYNDVHDGIFKDKLQLDIQTGSLDIRNIRTKHAGFYEVNITSRSYTIHQSFIVTLSDKVKSVSVIVGGPVTLQTHLTELQKDDLIKWWFVHDDSLIAQIYKLNKLSRTYDGEEGRFRGRLKLNNQTGYLTITDSKTEDTGLYEVKMSDRRRSIQRRFSVHVSEQGLSPGAVTGITISIILLAVAAAAAGVIYYRRKIAELLSKTKIVDEGKSVNLETDLTDKKRFDVIEWRFKETLIAVINPENTSPTTDYDDILFRGKLEMSDQTGDLNINNIRREHTGDYKLKIIRDGKTSYKKYFVSVRGERLEVYEGESVNLKTEVKDIKTDDVIEWTFKETLIAQINPADNIFSTYDGKYNEFRDKLKLTHQTGDLKINDSRWEHTGVYTLKIIRDGKTSDKTISVFVRHTMLVVDEGKSVNLKTEVKNIKRDDVIEWTFGETLIAKINPANKIFKTYDGDKGLFSGKLSLNRQTGDLNISDFREKHAGGYRRKIIRDGETSYRRFIVFVRPGGDSVGIEMDPLLNTSNQ